MAGPVITVAVCTHNRERLLEKTLASVVTQTLSPSLYEVVVVDNASKDGTRGVVEGFAKAAVAVRYVYEPRLGIANARNRAIAEASTALIAFMDDDACAEPGWLQALYDAYQSERRRPICLAGRILLDWEAPRPGWLSDRGLVPLGQLDYGDDQRDLRVPHEMPLGCNMAFERAALVALGGFHPELGRTAKALLGNEESALVRELHAAGGHSLYVPAAVIRHRVPAERLRVTWFLRRAFGQGRSDVIQSLLSAGVAPPVSKTLRDLARNLWRRLKHVVKHRDAQSLFRLGISAAYGSGAIRESLLRRGQTSGGSKQARAAELNGGLGAEQVEQGRRKVE